MMRPIREESQIQERLVRLNQSALPVPVPASDRLVVFSDLHMGDGCYGDDFKPNAPMFHAILQKHYLPERFGLILNGDIEELHRNRLVRIVESWKDTYRLFQRFAETTSFHKTIGNHDYSLRFCRRPAMRLPIHEAIKLQMDHAGEILIFHGHQAGHFYPPLHVIAGIFLRCIANPLRIPNYTISHHSRRRYAIEKRVYGFSRARKILSLIGHTHRPLFESMSKRENLRHHIESGCRRLVCADTNERQIMESAVQKLKVEFDMLSATPNRRDRVVPLYGPELRVPCLFNSGCVIGRRGLTAIEIDQGYIRLVHWFNRTITTKYFSLNGYHPHSLRDTDWCRVVLNEEPLDYIFARVRLLA